MSGEAARKLRSELRTILRHYRRWPSTREAPFLSFVLEEFRAKARESDERRAETLQRASRDYATLLASVTEYNRLRMLDTGAENLESGQDTMRRAAARAGLKLADKTDFDNPPPHGNSSTL